MTRREDGRWQESIVMNGKRKFFYGKTKTEVLKKIRAYHEELQDGPLFSEVADEWWEKAEKRIAHNTAKSYAPALERAKEAFDGVRINKIRPRDVARFIDRFSKIYAEKTVKTQLGIFNMIFTYAVYEGYAEQNVARDLKVPDGLKRTKRTSPPQSDIERVKRNISHPFGLLPFMAMYTGLRRGELMALRWSDIDVKRRTINVNKSIEEINGKPHVKLPKTKESIGVVPILDALLPYLQAKRIGVVFPNENGEYMTNYQFNRAWKQYQTDTGVTCTPHQLRHAYATMLFENDVPPEKAQILLRHAQLSTTMDIYRDIREDKIKAVHEDVYAVSF